MKPKMLFILLCILLTVQAMAQSENKKKDLTQEKKQTIIYKEPSNIPIRSTSADAKMILPDYKQNDIKTSFDTTSNSPKIKVLNQHYFGNNAIFPISNKMFFYIEGDQKSYLNLASYNLAYLALCWRFNNRLNLTGGVIAMKQFTNTSLYGVDRSGIRFNLNYSITDQLVFNIWGQYITGSPIYSPIDYLLPQTGTGTSMVLNLGGGSQLGIGAEYKKDENKDKWNYNAGGKLKFNF